MSALHHVLLHPVEIQGQVHQMVMKLGGFKKVTLEQTLEIANNYAGVYAAERFSQIDSHRLDYLFQRKSLD